MRRELSLNGIIIHTHTRSLCVSVVKHENMKAKKRSHIWQRKKGTTKAIIVMLIENVENIIFYFNFILPALFQHCSVRL